MLPTTCKMLSKNIQRHHCTTLGVAKRGRAVSNTILEHLQASLTMTFCFFNKLIVDNGKAVASWTMTADDSICQAPEPLTLNSTSVKCQQFSKFCSYKFVDIAKNTILSLSFSFKYEKLLWSHFQISITTYYGICYSHGMKRNYCVSSYILWFYFICEGHFF